MFSKANSRAFPSVLQRSLDLPQWLRRLQPNPRATNFGQGRADRKHPVWHSSAVRLHSIEDNAPLAAASQKRTQIAGVTRKASRETPPDSPCGAGKRHFCCSYGFAARLRCAGGTVFPLANVMCDQLARLPGQWRGGLMGAGNLQINLKKPRVCGWLAAMAVQGALFGVSVLLTLAFDCGFPSACSTPRG